jgi:hypothetical protein
VLRHVAAGIGASVVGTAAVGVASARLYDLLDGDRPGYHSYTFASSSAAILAVSGIMVASSAASSLGMTPLQRSVRAGLGLGGAVGALAGATWYAVAAGP